MQTSHQKNCALVLRNLTIGGFVRRLHRLGLAGAWMWGPFAQGGHIVYRRDDAERRCCIVFLSGEAPALKVGDYITELFSLATDGSPEIWRCHLRQQRGARPGDIAFFDACWLALLEPQAQPAPQERAHP